MKYIKKFETTNKPEIGDYVICEEEDIRSIYVDVLSFISTNIGRIISTGSEYDYIVKFENIPDKLLCFFTDCTRPMQLSEIKHYSKDKEELEMILNANKYNL